MPRRPFQILALSMLAMILPAWSQEPGRVAFEGTVVNRLTGLPLRNARLALQSQDPSVAGEFSTSTSANGVFQFRNVDPGKYLLFAERPGFEPQYYSDSGLSTHQGTYLVLGAGGTIKNLSIRLNPQSVISGRVLSEDGEPLAHVAVRAMRSTYISGKRQSVSVGQAMTDDLGEYRIFELSAGRYTVQAKAAALTSVIEQRSFAYVPMFYPNAEDPRSALPLQLAAGQTQSRIDFQLRRVPTVSIQGRVAGADGSGQGLMVYLVPRAMAGRGAGMVEKEAIPVRAGRFALQGVLPGSYVLVAEQFGETGGAKLSARAALDIRDNDVQGVDLVLAPGADIRGRVQLEQGAAPVAQLGESTDQPVHVSLQPVGDEGALVGSTADGSGSFRLKDVRPGFYQIAVYDLRSGYYVKSIRAGDEDITEKGLDSTRGAIPGEIVVLVSPNGGTLAGTVQNDSAGKLGGVQVLAIPATERGHLLRGALTDQAGHFEIKGLAPGDYRVFAFEELEPGAAEDPDFIKKFANKSHPVTIKERGSETVDVPAIPSALTQADQ